MLVSGWKLRLLSASTTSFGFWVQIWSSRFVSFLGYSRHEVWGLRLTARTENIYLHMRSRTFCDEPECDRRGVIFTIVNELVQHEENTHTIKPHSSKTYRCPSQHCPEKGKQWYRLHNFRQHCEWAHRGENIEDLIKLSVPNSSNDCA